MCTANRVLTQAVPRINLIKICHSQIKIFIIFITFYLENFNADVAIMMKIWDIAALQRVTKVGGAKRVSSELLISLHFLYYIKTSIKAHVI